MKTIRFQRKRFLIILFCALIILILEYYIWNDGHPASVCFVPDEVHEKMGEIIGKIQDALHAFNVSYFLCYDSLWGALKVKGPLPWHSNVDLCVLNKEVSSIDEGFLVRTFKRNGLVISYNSANGFYRVLMFGQTSPTATLTVFEEDSVTQQMRRVGWAHRMLPPGSCDKLHCFPPDLISPPLPTVTFGSHKLPAPREEIEIQKYLFPESWWKERNPDNCT